MACQLPLGVERMRQEICERLDDLPEVMVAIIHAQLSLLAQPSEQTAGGRKVDGRRQQAPAAVAANVLGALQMPHSDWPGSLLGRDGEAISNGSTHRTPGSGRG